MSQPTWFIIGASSGFGKAIADTVLPLNHNVIAAARSTTSDAMKDLASRGASLIDLDVTSPEADLAPKISKVFELYGRVDYVINGVGYMLGGANESISEEERLHQVTTNILGAMKIVKLLTPHLRAQHAAAGTGSPSPYSSVIANFGSLGSWTGFAGCGHYAATKWAIAGFSESMTDELAPFGIKVISVEPGYTRTNFLRDGATRWAENRLYDIYKDHPVESFRTLAAKYNGHQPGDVVKGAKVVVEVLTQTERAEGRGIPIRLVLGTDSYDVVENKCKSTLKLLEEWKDLSRATDHDDVAAGAAAAH